MSINPLLIILSREYDSAKKYHYNINNDSKNDQWHVCLSVCPHWICSTVFNCVLLNCLAFTVRFYFIFRVRFCFAFCVALPRFIYSSAFCCHTLLHSHTLPFCVVLKCCKLRFSDPVRKLTKVDERHLSSLMSSSSFSSSSSSLLCSASLRRSSHQSIFFCCDAREEENVVAWNHSVQPGSEIWRTITRNNANPPSSSAGSFPPPVPPFLSPFPFPCHLNEI